jgi:RNA polymerase sigma-70 factor, ECF subfamily
MGDVHEYSDEALARRALDDGAAFQALYDRYFRRIYGYVAARVAHHHDAEDIVSDIFLKVVRHLSRMRGRYPASFAAWLFSIARNAVTDYYRQNGRNPDTVPLIPASEPARQPGPESVQSDDEQSVLLRDLVARLPERKREIVMLKFYGGLRNQEIALVLNIGEKTVSAYLSRALDDLHQQYTSKSTETRHSEVRHDA